jgi:hypothetical protein
VFELYLEVTDDKQACSAPHWDKVIASVQIRYVPLGQPHTMVPNTPFHICPSCAIRLWPFYHRVLLTFTAAAPSFFPGAARSAR